MIGTATVAPTAPRRATNHVVIVVVGEALVDLVIAPGGSVEAALGGAPYNTARAAARLGADVEFVGGLSVDRFGSLLRERLEADGVATRFAVSTEAPTTLAAAEVGGDGAATYRFYFEGTSAPLVDEAAVGRAVASLGSADILFTGGLGLVLEPMATSVIGALDAVGAEVVVVIDVNCRPAVIPDRDAYVARIERAIARADIVKVSDEDLAYLLPTLDTAAAAQRVPRHRCTRRRRDRRVLAHDDRHGGGRTHRRGARRDRWDRRHDRRRRHVRRRAARLVERRRCRP